MNISSSVEVIFAPILLKLSFKSFILSLSLYFNLLALYNFVVPFAVDARATITGAKSGIFKISISKAFNLKFFLIVIEPSSLYLIEAPINFNIFNISLSP